MRGVFFWIAGAMAAFFFTAGAFLLLANLGTGLTNERSLPPRPQPENTGPSLELILNEEQIENIERRADQRLSLEVVNPGGTDLSDINITLRAASENTAVPESRYYRAAVEELPAGESTRVDFELDLSPLQRPGEQTPSGGLEAPRLILEIQAATPRGISTVKTVILPL